MPFWFPRSIFGGVLSLIYVVIAIWAVFSDRRSRGGDWISLRGMGSYLITLPISLPMEKLRHRLDYRNNLHMLASIFICAILIYFAAAAIGFGLLFLLHKI